MSFSRHLRAENDENVCREPFTPEEMVKMAGKLRPGIASEAKQRQHEGQKSGGRGKKKLCADSAQSLARSRVAIARAVGVSHDTLTKAEAVVESADKELIAEMNRTKRVGGVQPPVPRFVAHRHQTDADRPTRATRTPRFGRDARRCGRITLVDRPNPPRLPA